MATRRQLLKAMAALGVSQSFLARAMAQTRSAKTLVFIFMRGGVDGLSMVPPLGDPHYATLRPSLKLLSQGSGDDVAVRLDSLFGLHPSMSPLKKWFDAKQLAFVHAAGQANPSRSHFDAQDFLEGGIPGRKRADGFLNRVANTLSAGGNAFQTVAVQNSLPLSLAGDSPALAFPSLKEFRVGTGVVTAASFESLYDQAVDDALRGAGHDAFTGLALARQQDLSNAPAQNGATYPNSPLAKRLQDIARLIHAEVGTQIAVTDAGGFDTHLAQGAGKGQLANKLGDVAAALNAFATDLGERLATTCIVTVTEFGRTAKENGTRGTDHGTASAMLVLGGGVHGGRVISDWPSLAPDSLFEGRDLKVTTDVRSVLSECIEQTLQVKGSVAFPEFTAPSVGLFG